MLCIYIEGGIKRIFKESIQGGIRMWFSFMPSWITTFFIPGPPTIGLIVSASRNSIKRIFGFASMESRFEIFFCDVKLDGGF